jgi:hypothetical protein
VYYLKIKTGDEWILLSRVVYDTREEAEAALSRISVDGWLSQKSKDSVFDKKIEMRIHELGNEDMYRLFARNEFQEDGIIEVDADAEVRHADDGVWVQAWVWMDKMEEGGE